MSIRTSLKKLPIPKVVSLDAFGTIYTPKEPVSVQYFNIAKQYIRDLKEVKESNVISAIMKMRSKHPNYGKTTNLSQEQWWNEVIKIVFKDEKYDSKMIKHIFDHFIDKNAYHLYEDVLPLLQLLQRQGVKLVISSNSDDRLKQVVASLGLMEFFAIDDIYLSYDLECSKPSSLFFNKVLDDLCKKLGLEMSNLKTSMWHCGDDYKKDYQFAIDNGIRAIFVDREMQSGHLNQDEEYKFVGEHIIVKDLNVLTRLIE